MAGLGINLARNLARRVARGSIVGGFPFAADLMSHYVGRDAGSLIINERINQAAAVILGGTIAVFNDSTSKMIFNPPLVDDLNIWTLAFRGCNYVSGGLAFIVGGGSSNNLLSATGGYWGYRDNSGAYHAWNGTGNTQAVPTPLNSDHFDVIFFADGTNIHLVFNGEYKGYITGSTSYLYVNKFAKGYSNDALGVGGNYYDLRHWDFNIGQNEAVKYSDDSLEIEPTNEICMNGHSVDGCTGVEHQKIDINYLLDSTINILTLKALNKGFYKINEKQVINPKFNYVANLINIAILGDSTVAGFGSRHFVARYILNPNINIQIDISEGGETILEQVTDWDNLFDNEDIHYALIQIGINDLIQAEASEATIARYQTLIDKILLVNPNTRIILSTMTPCNSYWVNREGEIEGARIYQRWLDINNSIRGIFSTNLTGNYSFVDEHTDLLGDENDNLLLIYDEGDMLHENNPARKIIGELWDDAISNAEGIQEMSKNVFHNLIESLIGFNETGSDDSFYDYFDRSNAVVYTALALGGDYDATDRASKCRFSISELTNEATLRSYFVSGEDYKMFLKILPSHLEQNYIDEMVVYKTNKEGSELTKVEKWAKM